MSNLLARRELRFELNRVAAASHKKKGTVLFRRGDPANGVFLIRKGKVNLHLDGKTRLYPPRILGRGAIIGLPATLCGETYSLTAEVSEDAVLAFVPRENFLALMAKDTKLCLEAMNLLGKEIASIRSALVSRKIKKASFILPPLTRR
jgi:CRP-like cAMP-binding protein